MEPSGQTLLVNFFAVYWLSSGLLGLQWSRSTQQKKGWWLVVSVLEMAVGVGLLLRPVYVHFLAPGLGIKIFGVIALGVGLARLFGASISRDVAGKPSLGVLSLGLFGVGLGLLLFFSGELEPFTKLLAGGWAFVGGIVLILQSLQLRRATVTLS